MNNDERPPGIREVDNLHVDPAPVGDLLHAGHTAKRRRRTIIASVAAVTVLLVGGGFVTTQVVGSDDNDGLVTDGNSVDPGDNLKVDVQAYTAGGPARGTASWEPDAHAIRYVSRLGYSSSCPPEGSATAEDGVVRLTLTTVQHDDVPCTADSRQMIATIGGLTAPPTELFVTGDGKDHSVPVAGAEPDDLKLQCASGTMSGATPLILPPEGEADAKDWARTPEDAAQRIVNAQNRAGFSDQVLGAAEPVARPGSPEGAKPNAVRYTVLESGGLTGRITVEEMGFGAYAGTFIEVCSSPANEPIPAAVDLPSSDWRPGDAALEALVSGVLSVDENDCVYLDSNSGDRADRVYAMWPAGYSATLDDNNNLTLFDSNGDPVAYSGDSLTMGGGYGSAPSTEPCLPASAVEVATVMSDVEVQAP